ncbi:MAG: DUF1588 domain-containing protein, partial [Gemmataceae bacterium]
EILDKDLDAGHFVKSDFAMLNERLAVHYGISGIKGAQIRRVAVPRGCPRGPFLTQGAILKVTADGTTTSPVKRGSFVMDRLLGRPPQPPPPDLPVIEPDVRGATTIRDQLAKHRSQAACAACHARFDPPGFALEAFDVIGGARTHYRSLGAGAPAPRGSIDPFIHIHFRLGRPVDPAGELLDGRKFHDVRQLQDLLVADRGQLLKNFARQLAVYGTGRDVSFADRQQIAAIVANTQKGGGGIRTLIHELIQSRLFRTR